jgi:hypothetical protein
MPGIQAIRTVVAVASVIQRQDGPAAIKAFKTGIFFSSAHDPNSLF